MVKASRSYMLQTSVAILTGGGDPHYASDLTDALLANHISVDLIGSDSFPQDRLSKSPNLKFLNLRGDTNAKASNLEKLLRIYRYYIKLIVYSISTNKKVFHILWNNRFEHIDRTILMFLYRVLGKQVTLTAHNINAGERDGNDSTLNRLTLGIQYKLSKIIFVHTEKMADELESKFGIAKEKIKLIPYGSNQSIPRSNLDKCGARERLGIAPGDKAILFFGNIAPYKGLIHLVEAFIRLKPKEGRFKLIIAGRIKCDDSYWSSIQSLISDYDIEGRVLQRTEFIPDHEIEIYCKAADVMILPYTHIFQSGILVLGYSFGLPIIVSDVGSLKNEVIEGKTGYVFKPEDSGDLALKLTAFFESEVYSNHESTRRHIEKITSSQHSWKEAGAITAKSYRSLVS